MSAPSAKPLATGKLQLCLFLSIDFFTELEQSIAITNKPINASTVSLWPAQMPSSLKSTLRVSELKQASETAAPEADSQPCPFYSGLAPLPSSFSSSSLIIHTRHEPSPTSHSPTNLSSSVKHDQGFLRIPITRNALLPPNGPLEVNRTACNVSAPFRSLA